MDENPLNATCAVCGAQFEAHPGSFVEAGVSIWQQPEESAGELVEAGQAIFVEPWMNAETLAEKLNIEVADAERLLAGEDHVDTGAEAWCDKCIDEAFEE